MKTRSQINISNKSKTYQISKQNPSKRPEFIYENQDDTDMLITKKPKIRKNSKIKLNKNYLL